MTSPTRTLLVPLLVIGSVAGTLAAPASAYASPKTRHKTAKLHSPSTAEQIQQVRQDMQAQIDALKQQLSQRDAALTSVTDEVSRLQQQSTEQVARSQEASGTIAQNTADVSHLQSAVAEVKDSGASTATRVLDIQKTTDETRKEVESPATLRYKHLTITPGGFIAADAVWRQRALNADIYTNWNGTPYPGAAEAHTSEFVPSARQTRPSILITGKVPFGSISGFLEADFLAAGSTSNNLQTNSYIPRFRQAWFQAAFGRTTITGGQMWTLLTEDKFAANPGQENLPLFFDGDTHVGFTYVRQTGLRIQEAFTPKFALAASVENSQYQFSATNALPNFFFGAAGAAAGTENPLANYTNQVSPDVLVKASFDPGFGHYEIGGIARFFRDRYYPLTTSAAGAQNDTELGGGLSASARFPVTSKAQVGLHVTAGDGTGRYGASLLPDVTVRPDGRLEPLRNALGIASLEVHPTPRFDIFGYGGTEYVQRTYYRSAAGTLIGYAPPTASNVGCNTEALPTGATGYAPGTGSCVGATRDILQGSIGWLYRVYSGPDGKLQYGMAYSYLVKQGWAGVGGAPEATNNLIYTSLRYYLP